MENNNEVEIDVNLGGFVYAESPKVLVARNFNLGIAIALYDRIDYSGWMGLFRNISREVNAKRTIEEIIKERGDRIRGYACGASLLKEEKDKTIISETIRDRLYVEEKFRELKQFNTEWINNHDFYSNIYFYLEEGIFISRRINLELLKI